MQLRMLRSVQRNAKQRARVAIELRLSGKSEHRTPYMSARTLAECDGNTLRVGDGALVVGAPFMVVCHVRRAWARRGRSAQALSCLYLHGTLLSPLACEPGCRNQERNRTREVFQCPSSVQEAPPCPSVRVPPPPPPMDMRCVLYLIARVPLNTADRRTDGRGPRTAGVGDSCRLCHAPHVSAVACRSAWPRAAERARRGDELTSCREVSGRGARSGGTGRAESGGTRQSRAAEQGGRSAETPATPPRARTKMLRGGQGRP